MTIFDDIVRNTLSQLHRHRMTDIITNQWVDPYSVCKTRVPLLSRWIQIRHRICTLTYEYFRTDRGWRYFLWNHMQWVVDMPHSIFEKEPSAELVRNIFVIYDINPNAPTRSEGNLFTNMNHIRTQILPLISGLKVCCTSSYVERLSMHTTRRTMIKLLRQFLLVKGYQLYSEITKINGKCHRKYYVRCACEDMRMPKCVAKVIPATVKTIR